tara:strand:- start:63 stop:215 length:153 start_codon:yes stop_codon:yes gene_type:complete
MMMILNMICALQRLVEELGCSGLVGRVAFFVPRGETGQLGQVLCLAGLLL